MEPSNRNTDPLTVSEMTTPTQYWPINLETEVRMLCSKSFIRKGMNGWLTTESRLSILKQKLGHFISAYSWNPPTSPYLALSASAELSLQSKTNGYRRLLEVTYGDYWRIQEITGGDYWRPINYRRLLGNTRDYWRVFCAHNSDQLGA